MKSNTKKRLIAFMLCMVLVLSSAISAFADEGTVHRVPTDTVELSSEIMKDGVSQGTLFATIPGEAFQSTEENATLQMNLQSETEESTVIENIQNELEARGITEYTIHQTIMGDVSFSVSPEANAQIPENERPEYTSGYEGFYHLTDMQGSVEHAVLKYILRDHDRDLFEKKKDIIKKAAESINMEYGEGTASYVIKDQYYNMKEKLEDAMFLIEDAKNAMEELGIVPKINPIRGGTDGARLSYMGVPCPNICTGGHNYHGRYEYCCIQSMEKITELLIKLAKRGE